MRLTNHRDMTLPAFLSGLSGKLRTAAISVLRCRDNRFCRLLLAAEARDTLDRPVDGGGSNCLASLRSCVSWRRRDSISVSRGSLTIGLGWVVRGLAFVAFRLRGGAAPIMAPSVSFLRSLSLILPLANLWISLTDSLPSPLKSAASSNSSYDTTPSPSRSSDLKNMDDWALGVKGRCTVPSWVPHSDVYPGSLGLEMRLVRMPWRTESGPLS